MKLKLVNPFNQAPLHIENNKLIDDQGSSFDWVNGAWRFVDSGNYADTFGYQWNKFEKTQIDRYQKGIEQSRIRFFAETEWDNQNLKDQNILEVGSGAGRFTQVVLDHTQATLYSIDYSNAVEANFRNNGLNDRLHLFQGSIYDLPFAPAQFDKVFCFGVLQHTPNFRESISSLINMVKPGGELVVDFYSIKGWYTKIHSKYILRPITKRLSKKALLNLITMTSPVFIQLYRIFNKLGIGKVVNRFLPICDINNTLPRELSRDQLKEWVILDTFDMFSPTYDQPQKIETVKMWFEQFGMKVTFADFIRFQNNQVAVVKGIKL